MAKMALRVYTREIEELIDHGQIKESIAHARHILASFPKYVDAYRLLGKAYLEEQLYGDAADIFQRVLSAKPDDFISNVGMSIIREDEGNLDASIWHMERAFEVQPSNKAIQDELRRLFGRRDGMQPPKIRLTRGALARMYAHGDLYDQAIAEAKATLEDDPQRHDMQILLAKMYYKSGKSETAIEICNYILEKLPFCLDANYILSKIYLQSGQQEEADYYKMTVASLDPYSVMTTKTAPLSENVAANSVTIEHLEWHPGMMSEMGGEAAWGAKLGLSAKQKDSGEAEKPEWLTATYDEEGEDSAGGEAPFVMDEEKMESPSEELPEWIRNASVEESSQRKAKEETVEDLPDWLRGEGSVEPSTENEAESGDWEEGVGLSDLESAETGSEYFDSESAPMDTAAAQELPDFLRDAGWEEGSGEPGEPSFFGSEQQDTGDADISPGDIPDWMQELRPKETDPQAAEIDLGDLSLGVGSDDAIDWIGGSETEESANGTALDWMGGGDDEMRAEAAALDWNTGGETEENAEGTAMGSLAGEKTDEDEEIPEWMVGLGEGIGDTAIAEEETSDWLHGLAGEDAVADPNEAQKEPLGWMGREADTEFSEESGTEDESSDWLSADQAEQDQEVAARLDWLGQAGEEEAPNGADAGWMSSAEEESAATAAEAGEPPAWMPQVDEDAAGEIPDPASMGSSAEAQKAETSGPEEDVPEWMQGMVSEEPVQDDVAEMLPGDDEEPAFDSMEWLEGLPGKSEIEAEAGEEIENAPVPTWMDEISAEHEALSAQEAEAGEMEQPGGDYVLGIDDQAMSWLEGLAAKQGAPEEELFSDPESREQEMPAWLKGIEEGSDDVAPAPPVSSAEAPEEIPAESESEQSWLDSLSEEADAEGGFGVRTGGDTSQLIRSLVFDPEGKPLRPDREPTAGEKSEMETSESPAVLPTAAPSAPRASSRPAFDSKYQEGLELLHAGDLNGALQSFSDLIKRGQYLDEIIGTLQEAMIKYPIEIGLYQTMGDAYMRADRLQDALDSYSKAEELLR